MAEQAPAPHVEKAIAYARGVVDLSIEACKWIRLSCERFLDDLEQVEREDYPYVFDPEAGERPCRFIELLPHTRGRWAAKRELIRLEPWQCFFVVNLFGWLRKADGLRRFRTALLIISRKNGKSLLAAAIGLYMLCADGEHGAEVYAGATSEKQAWEVFRPARLMALAVPKLQAHFGLTVGAKNLHIASVGSRFEPIIGNPGDGSSPSMASVDEYHEHKNDALYDTMRTGMGARDQPIMLVTSTAGSNIAGPCYALQGNLQSVLDGVVVDDTMFGMIYTIDEGVDWTSDLALRMANPNMGISVSAEFLRLEQANAIRDSRKQNIFKIKHLDMWVQARTAWMNMEWWARQARPELRIEDFTGAPCWIGVDLSNRIDLASVGLLFQRGEDYFLFSRNYLPEETATDPARQEYHGWAFDGLLTVTDGARLDLERIEEDLVEDLTSYDVQEIAYDPWGATGLEQRLSRRGAPMVEFPQQTKFYSPAMKDMEALTKEGRLFHDGNPILAWGISNVTAKVDANENVFPRKERPENKIDPATAAMQAIGRATVSQGPVPPPHITFATPSNSRRDSSRIMESF